jgi:triosephosphate isomerase
MTDADTPAAVRRPFFFGTNFKMHQTPEETTAFIAALGPAVREALAGHGDAHLFVIPPFTSLPAAVAAARGTDPPLWVGAQNMHQATEGAYTDEISARMLQAVGVDLVLLGHAERRALFAETDAALNAKVAAALGAGFRVLLCVGETAEEKGFGVGAETVARQLKIALHGLDPARLSGLLVGYEPVWSIGAGGTPAQPADVTEATGAIRAALASRFGEPGGRVPILYGGSVNAENCGAVVALEGIDGLFIGRSAWQVEGFARVLAAALAAR